MNSQDVVIAGRKFTASMFCFECRPKVTVTDLTAGGPSVCLSVCLSRRPMDAHIRCLADD